MFASFSLKVFSCEFVRACFCMCCAFGHVLAFVCDLMCGLGFVYSVVLCDCYLFRVLCVLIVCMCSCLLCVCVLSCVVVRFECVLV